MEHERLNIDLKTRLAVNPGLVLRVEDDDCALLYDPDNGRVQMLNETAVEIWRLLDGQRTLRNVIARLRERYDGFDAEGENQVLAMTQALAALGAVGVWEQD